MVGAFAVDLLVVFKSAFLLNGLIDRVKDGIFIFTVVSIDSFGAVSGYLAIG